ncbi:hypothetical protein [Hafnia psychrotolerans]|nr:hypothetical protein [Hafnia psychrotolerans]
MIRTECHHLIVLHEGKRRAQGEDEAMFNVPAHADTRALLSR